MGGGGGFHAMGGGGGFHAMGGSGGGFHPSPIGGGAHVGGGIAGGGWHGGLPGGGAHLGGVGGLPGGAGHMGAMGGFPGGVSHLPGGGFPGVVHVPGGVGHVAGFPGHVSVGGFSGYGAGWHGGVPGAGAYWAHAHPYGWYNGYWHNHWYGNGFGGYWGGWRYPLGWGLAGFGLGSLWYSSGYMPYYNPYYSALPGTAGVYNYAQPIPVTNGAAFAGGPNALDPNLVASDPNAVAPSAVDPNAIAGNPDIDTAVERFRAGDYARALTLVDDAILAQPSDAAAHELRGLILFAMEDYSQAAGTVHSVLSIGPGWDWTTLTSLYPDMRVYTRQLQALEAFVNSHPRQADARFLLAYHYMTEGHTEDAALQLQRVVELMPNDKLAADLLRMVHGNAEAPPPAQPPAPIADGKSVDPALLVGSWHAGRDDGSTFNLTLGNDESFTWKFAQQQHAETIEGTYSVDKGLLVLQGKTGGAMVGQLSGAARDRFTFKPLGGPPDDSGLTFTR